MIPPYYPNPDGMSCGQCVYKMILEYFFSHKTYTFEEMDDFCGAIPNKYTWTYKPVIELNKLGLDIQVYCNFDTKKFIQNPEKYLLEIYGEKGADDSINNSNIPSALEQAKDYMILLKSGEIEEKQESFTPSTLRHLLDQDYMICLWVNYRKLNGKEGYVGHFILVHNYDDNGFVAHDPGGDDVEGQIKNRYISENLLIDAASPVTIGETSDLIAVRKQL